ncbi:MAG: hypothetical protein ACRDBF_12105, partial [Plesiomonas shigelloides]
EAYRQKFRGHLKAANQTFVEFAREKGTLFDKWCQSSKVNNFEQLREPKSVGFACVTSSPIDCEEQRIDSGYDPFVFSGVVFLTGQEKYIVPIRILRDTGSAQSFVLSKGSYCGSDVLVQGIEFGIVRVPLHYINSQSDLVSGFVKIAVRSQLPIKGVDLILGNDLAGGKVLPFPEVIENPLTEPPSVPCCRFCFKFNFCISGLRDYASAVTQI